MIKKYIIDGNNLIGKVPELIKLQRENKKGTRSKIAFMLDRYFAGKKVKVTLHFDGHKSETLVTSKLKIEYSENRTADDKIKDEIMHDKNPKLIAVVSSDNNVIEFAKVNSCKVIKSEAFAKLLKEEDRTDSEEARIKDISDKEMKKLFGIN